MRMLIEVEVGFGREVWNLYLRGSTSWILDSISLARPEAYVMEVGCNTNVW